MVQELERVKQTSEFSEAGSAVNWVFFRMSSSHTEEARETLEQLCDRTLCDLAKLEQIRPMTENPR